MSGAAHFVFNPRLNQRLRNAETKREHLNGLARHGAGLCRDGLFQKGRRDNKIEREAVCFVFNFDWLAGGSEQHVFGPSTRLNNTIAVKQRMSEDVRQSESLARSRFMAIDANNEAFVFDVDAP